MIVFVSYRRDDTLLAAASLFRSLQRHYKPEDIFFDLPRQSPGADLFDKLTAAVRSSDVVVAMIGRQWLERLNEEGDAVRLEIEIAFETRKRIFPVLVDGVRMPPVSGLPEHLRGIRRFEAAVFRPLELDQDVDALVAAIEAERHRIREEARLSQLVAGALRENNYAAAVNAAEELIGVSQDAGAAPAQRDEIRREHTYRIAKSSPIVARAQQSLAQRLFDDALLDCDQALQISPGEPDYLRLWKQIARTRTRAAEARDEQRINDALDRLTRLAAVDLIQFADAAVEALNSSLLTVPRIQSILESHAGELRNAVIRYPRTQNLRAVYLKSRTHAQEEQDASRAKSVLSIGFLSVTYGLAAALAWWSDSAIGLALAAPATMLVFMTSGDEVGGCLAGSGFILSLLFFTLIAAGIVGNLTPCVVGLVELALAIAFAAARVAPGDRGPLPFRWYFLRAAKVKRILHKPK